MVAATNPTDLRFDAIRRAAIPVFATHGFKGASMAEIARAAGVSRPALYQYFENRGDVFRAAFDAVLNDATDRALAALGSDGSLAERLDGYLQRAFGDGYQSLAATPFGGELIDAKYEFAADIAATAHQRARAGLRRFLADRAPSKTVIGAAIDLLTLAPVGLKADGATPRVYRRRLTALADAAAAMLAAG